MEGGRGGTFFFADGDGKAMSFSPGMLSSYDAKSIFGIAQYVLPQSAL